MKDFCVGSEKQTVELPVLGTYVDMIRFLPARHGEPFSYWTLTKWVKDRRFKKGVYIGNGIFNMKVLAWHLENSGTFLKDRR